MSVFSPLISSDLIDSSEPFKEICTNYSANHQWKEKGNDTDTAGAGDSPSCYLVESEFDHFFSDFVFHFTRGVGQIARKYANKHKLDKTQTNALVQQARECVSARLQALPKPLFRHVVSPPLSSDGRFGFAAFRAFNAIVGDTVVEQTNQQIQDMINKERKMRTMAAQAGHGGSA